MSQVEMFIKNRCANITIPGGCTECPEHHATYDKVYVGLYEECEIKPTISYTQHSGCRNPSCSNSQRLFTLDVSIPMNKIAFIFTEHYFEVDSKIHATRQLIYGRYRKCKIVEIKK